MIMCGYIWDTMGLHGMSNFSSLMGKSYAHEKNILFMIEWIKNGISRYKSWALRGEVNLAINPDCWAFANVIE